MVESDPYFRTPPSFSPSDPFSPSAAAAAASSPSPADSSPKWVGDERDREFDGELCCEGGFEVGLRLGPLTPLTPLGCDGSSD